VDIRVKCTWPSPWHPAGSGSGACADSDFAKRSAFRRPGSVAPCVVACKEACSAGFAACGPGLHSA